MTGLLSIYDVKCPYCGADVGRPCITAGAYVRVTPHLTRRIAFRERNSDTGGSE